MKEPNIKKDKTVWILNICFIAIPLIILLFLMVKDYIRGEVGAYVLIGFGALTFGFTLICWTILGVISLRLAFKRKYYFKSKVIYVVFSIILLSPIVIYAGSITTNIIKHVVIPSEEAEFDLRYKRYEETIERMAEQTQTVQFYNENINFFQLSNYYAVYIINSKTGENINRMYLDIVGKTISISKLDKKDAKRIFGNNFSFDILPVVIKN